MSKSHDLRVKIDHIGETEEVGQNGFKKREVIGIIEGEYPEHYKFEFIQDKTSLPDTMLEGTYATIHFNIKGRKVEPKKKGEQPMYFTSLQAWKVDVGEKQS